MVDNFKLRLKLISLNGSRTTIVGDVDGFVSLCHNITVAISSKPFQSSRDVLLRLRYNSHSGFSVAFVAMEFCDCIDEWSAVNYMVKLQHFFDAVTAFAYFCIPLELIYFIRVHGFFPHKLAIIYFGSFCILCGARYVTDMWKYSQYSETSASVIKNVQVCTAVASWLTVVVMYFVLPKLISLKENEHLLKYINKDLDERKSLMLREVATRRSIVSLIDGIRSTVDGQCIVKSTVVGLGQIFNLEECSFWFPSLTNKTLRLSHSLNHSISVGSAVPMNLPIVAEIFNTTGPVRIPHFCPLVRAKKSKCAKRTMKSEAVAIKVPLSLTESDDSLNACAMSYAVMVLVLPSDNVRKFREYELGSVRAVAEQVSVALDHASAIEESSMACNHLKKQISSKEVALKDIEVALRNFKKSKTGTFHQMEMPVYALTLLSSILLETTLTSQQRAMAEKVLRSSSHIEALLQNERELSELQDGTLKFNHKLFNLSDFIKQVVNMIKPAAVLKKLSLSLALAPDLPVNAIGDHDRLMHVFLKVLGNAVKFTKEGHISVTASLVKPKTYRGWRPFKFHLVSSDAHFNLRVQVEDSGCGIDPQDLRNLFHPSSASNHHSGTTLGLPICKRLLEAMGGRIWVESDGLGKGCMTIFIIKLGTV